MLCMSVSPWGETLFNWWIILALHLLEYSIAYARNDFTVNLWVTLLLFSLFSVIRVNSQCFPLLKISFVEFALEFFWMGTSGSWNNRLLPLFHDLIMYCTEMLYPFLSISPFLMVWWFWWCGGWACQDNKYKEKRAILLRTVFSGLWAHLRNAVFRHGGELN